MNMDMDMVYACGYGILPQNLLSPLLNTLSRMVLKKVVLHINLLSLNPLLNTLSHMVLKRQDGSTME